MIKKFLCAVTFIALVLNLSGCTSNNAETATESEKAPAKVDYIVSKAPATAREGVKDPTTGFVKINPTFSVEALPEKSDKAPSWVKDGLGSKIPAIDNGNILEVINTNDQFLVYVANIDEKGFQKYYEKLAAAGYQFCDNNNWESFGLYNDSYDVNMRFGQDGPNVTTIRAKIRTAEPKAEANTDKK